MEGVPSRHIANLHRKHPLLRNSTHAFLWEQRSFFAGMLPTLLRTKPAAIYLGEYQLYCYLYKLRAALGLSYSLVLYTGGQAIPGLFDPSRDFIHHVTDAYLPQCQHLPAKRQWLLPHRCLSEAANRSPVLLAAAFVRYANAWKNRRWQPPED